MPTSLEVRVDQLERQARNLRRVLLASVAVAIVAIGFLVTGAEASGPKDIVASSIHLKSPQGKHSASLAATDDGFVGLFFRDLNGQQRMALMMTPSGKATLTFADGHASRMEVGVVDDAAQSAENYSVSLRDANGKVLWQPPTPNAVDVQQ